MTTNEDLSADALEAAVKRIAELEAERDSAHRIIESHTCGENVELAYRRTLEAQHERDRLAAVIEQVKGLPTQYPVTGRTRVMDLLASAETDAALNEVRAEAWDEGLSAGADRWMDSREFGDPPVNPYRKEPTDD